jgi:hypothetical protein
MRKIFLIALAATLAVAFVDPALAAKKKKGRKGPKVSPEVQFQQALNRLDPQTRLEQICDREAMKRIKEDKKLPVDRAQGQASAEPKTDGQDRRAQAHRHRRSLSQQGRVVRTDVHLPGVSGPYEGVVLRVPDRRGDPESQVGGLRTVELKTPGRAGPRCEGARDRRAVVLPAARRRGDRMKRCRRF